MSLKILSDRFRKPAAPPVAALAKPDPEAEARATRAAAAAQGRIDRAEKAAAAAEAKATAAEARAASQHLQSEVTAAAGRLRVLNAAQVTQLASGRYELVDGKVRSKLDPSKDLEADLGEWLASEGKHFLPAAVPGGGSGAPANPAAPKAAAPRDLSTQQGRDAYAAEVNAARGAKPRAQAPS